MPAWLEASSARPWAGTRWAPSTLHPPPAVVEEAEERLDQVGELLVEAPLVVLVLALEAAQHALERVARVARQRRGAARERVGQLEPRVEPLAQAAHEGQRGEGSVTPRHPVLHAPRRSSSAAGGRPRSRAGRCRRRARSAAGAGSRPSRRPARAAAPAPVTGPNSGPASGSGGRPRHADHPREPDRPARGDVHRAAHRSPDRGDQRRRARRPRGRAGCAGRSPR